MSLKSYATLAAIGLGLTILSNEAAAADHRHGAHTDVGLRVGDRNFVVFVGSDGLYARPYDH